MADNSNNKKLHIAMFPWLAFGHISPYLELAKLMAQKGHKISFISTPRNIDRLPKIPSRIAPLIDFIKLPFPHLQDLPEKAEATSDIPGEKIPSLLKAFDALENPLTTFLQTSKPDWIVYDYLAYWVAPTAAKFGISRAYLAIMWAATHCFLGQSTSDLINNIDQRTSLEDYTVCPNWMTFPSEIVLQLHEAVGAFNAMHIDASGVSLRYRFGSSISGCDVFAIRSCKELDFDYLSLLGKFHEKPIIPVGLLPPSILVTEDIIDNTWLTTSKWLDKHNKRSVVYIAFGSEARLSQEQLNELALGLELSGLPFFWALRKGDDWLEMPDGFEERTRERGVVWTSWVPQLKVLAHDSIGGFFTHCGSSSAIEGLHFGLPLIMLPLIADQGLMAKFFEEMKAGVKIPRREEDGFFTRNDVVESLRMVMVDDYGVIFKNKANELMKMLADEELHRGYVDNFVQCLENHRCDKGIDSRRIEAV